MGSPIPAALIPVPSPLFTPLEDPDWDVDACVETIPDDPCVDYSALWADLASIEISRQAVRQKRQRMMANAAICFMQAAGVQMLDADFDPWGVGAPASLGFVDHAPIGDPSPHQMAFIHTLASVRNILETNPNRPLVVYTAMQSTSVPSDTILLNLMFYLSAHDYLIEPKVERQKDGTFAAHILVVG